MGLRLGLGLGLGMVLGLGLGTGLELGLRVGWVLCNTAYVLRLIFKIGQPSNPVQVGRA